MDVDVELSSDRISEFLRGKLSEIKSVNKQLENSLKSRQEIIVNLRKKLFDKNDETTLSFGPVWKRTLNTTTVLGFSITNECESNAENVSVLLDWTSSLPLNYNYRLIASNNTDSLTDAFNSTSTLEKYGHIVITLTTPSFVDYPSYSLSASVAFQQKQRQCSVKVPASIQLSCEDVTDRSTFINATSGEVVDLLALVSAQQKYEFIMVIDDNCGRLLEDGLQVDCSLCKCNVSSSTTLFVARELGSVLDGSGLAIHRKSSTIIQLSIYSKDRETAIAFLHYLYKHFTDFNATPLGSHRHNPEDVTNSLKKALLDELQQLEGNMPRSDLKDVKMSVAALENATDDLLSVAKENSK